MVLRLGPFDVGYLAGPVGFLLWEIFKSRRDWFRCPLFKPGQTSRAGSVGVFFFPLPSFVRILLPPQVYHQAVHMAYGPDPNPFRVHRFPVRVRRIWPPLRRGHFRTRFFFVCGPTSPSFRGPLPGCHDTTCFFLYWAPPLELSSSLRECCSTLPIVLRRCSQFFFCNRALLTFVTAPRRPWPRVFPTFDFVLSNLSRRFRPPFFRITFAVIPPVR